MTFEHFLPLGLTANIYLFKVNNRKNGKRCDIWSKLTIKHQNNVIDVVLVSLLLTLNIFHPVFSTFSIANFEHVFVCWVGVFLVSSLLDIDQVFTHNAEENCKNFFKNSHPRGYSVMKIPANFSKNKMRPYLVQKRLYFTHTQKKFFSVCFLNFFEKTVL